MSSTQQHNSGPDSDGPEVPEPSHAERAKTLVYLQQTGGLSTISRKQPGWPFGSVMPYGLDEQGQPLFLISTMGAASFGFQFGAQMSEVVLLVLTQRGVDSLLLGNFKLGADGSVAVGPVGAGVSGATTPNLSADLLSFVRAKGLFAGVSLEGAVLISRDEWSRAYYGKPVTSTDIVIRREVKNPHSDVLRTEIRNAIEGK